MKRWSSRFVLLAALGAPALPSFGQAPAARPAVPPPAQPAEPVSTPADDPWEERKARAREDVAYLEALQRAKQAEVREGELRVTASIAWKHEQDQQKKRGLLTPFQVRQAEIFLAEAETQLEMRKVETKDVEIRLARSKRRLRAIEVSPSAIEPETSTTEDRFRDLELKYTRLRDQFERVKRIIDGQLKNNP